MAKQNIPFPSLDTPVVLVDLDKLEANIREMSQLVAEAGIRLRPHVKVHECAEIAKMQIEAGACGIEVGPMEQAEAMAEQGVEDIVIAHPGFYGGPRGGTLKRLLGKPGLRITIVVDMFEQAEGISLVAQAAGKKVSVLIKVEPDIVRYGVLPGEPVLELAKKLRQLPGIELIGIYSHEFYAYELGAEPTAEGLAKAASEVASMTVETAKMLRRESIPIEHVSVGSSSTFRATCRYIKEGKFPEITEIHPGQCVIGDIMYMMSGGNTREACAVTVLTTVMSTPQSSHAVIDAGYKTLGAESIIRRRENPGFFWEGRPRFGSIQGRPDLWLGYMDAEASCVYYMEPEKKLSLGERLEIVPNNATLVINIHDQIYGVRNGVVEKVIAVTGRGKGN